MAQRLGDQLEMPDVPKPDLTDALSEIWFSINYAAYHLAYVRVYSQSAALRTDKDELRSQEQTMRDNAQIDIVICRTHLAAFFWHLDHVFEALKSAITRGQNEHQKLQYFWDYEKQLKVIEQYPLRQGIKNYRNMGHQIPAIIGCKWDSEGHFLYHFLPIISGHEQKEPIDMNTQLQRYFEFVTNVWIEFAPGDFKEKFPRDFRFPVTVPYMFLGNLPKELNAVPQLEVSIESYDRVTEIVTVEKKTDEEH
jgi:hypothetical protein